MSTRQNFTRVISDSRESARMLIVSCNTAPGFTHNPPHHVHRNLAEDLWKYSFIETTSNFRKLID